MHQLFFSGIALSDRPLFLLPLGFSSAFLGSLYLLSWFGDPCSMYRPEMRRRNLSRNSLTVVNNVSSLGSEGPVVLVKKKQSRSVHTLRAVTFTAFAFAVWKSWHQE